MPKMRGFKPSLWTDDRFCDLSPLARLLWMGMWTYACDNGHVEDSPRQLRRQVLPEDPCDAEALVAQIEAAGLIARDGGWITVRNLRKHQKQDRRYFVTCDCPGCEVPEEFRAPVEQRRETKRDQQRRARGARSGDSKGAQGVPVGHTPSARRVPDVSPPGARVEVEVEVEELPTTPPASATAPALTLVHPAADAAGGELPLDVPPAPVKARPIEDQLTREWWEHLDVKPGGAKAYPAARAAIKAVLKVGHSADTVRAALVQLAPPLSIARIEYQINRNRPASTGPGAVGLDSKWDDVDVHDLWGTGS